MKTTKSIKEYIVDYFTIIKEGYTIKDKLVLFKYFLEIPKRAYLRKKGKKYPPVLSKEVMIKNKDGVFFCGRSFLMAQGAISNYEPEATKKVNLQEGVFIDIGANIGRYAILQARKLKKGKVIAIEPDPTTFKILEKNISLNKLKNIIPVNFACANKKGLLDFWLGAEGDGTAHSLFEIKYRAKKIKVKADTLDNILKNVGVKKVDLIKIDVEGAELLVFKGAKKTLKKDRPKIIFEALSKDKYLECKKELNKYGYKIKQLSDKEFFAE